MPLDSKAAQSGVWPDSHRPGLPQRRSPIPSLSDGFVAMFAFPKPCFIFPIQGVFRGVYTGGKRA